MVGHLAVQPRCNEAETVTSKWLTEPTISHPPRDPDLAALFLY